MSDPLYAEPSDGPGPEKGEGKNKMALGSVQLLDRHTNQVILIPTPSDDPNDPLNWSQTYKYFIAALVCLAMTSCTFLAAGPTIAIVETATDFFPGYEPSRSIPLVAYFFTTTALVQGTSNFVWVPLANKYGRRPVYVISYAIYLVAAVWLIFERSFAGFLAGRLLMGFGSGAAEALAPLTISDIFFLHERGAVMALYTSFLAIGAALGILIDGFIVIHNSWRIIYQAASVLIALILLLFIFTFPETAYRRGGGHPPSGSGATGNTTTEIDVINDNSRSDSSSGSNDDKEQNPTIMEEGSTTAEEEKGRKKKNAKRSYVQSLRLFPSDPFTTESLTKMSLRPLGVIILPSVLWAALVQSVMIGFLVAVTSNVAVAYADAYGFRAWQVGLAFSAAIAGAVIGAPAGGRFGDVVADHLTRRAGGVRTPEMRLPATMLSLITTPLALVLFGVGVQHKLHWICPTIGLGLLNFSISQATNICLVYIIDCYRPIAGEVTLATLGFKSVFGFLLSFYTNPWIEQVGYQTAYGTMAAIAAFFLLLWVPLYFWGDSLRQRSWKWKLISYVHWTSDREVGE